MAPWHPPGRTGDDAQMSCRGWRQCLGSCSTQPDLHIAIRTQICLKCLGAVRTKPEKLGCRMRLFVGIQVAAVQKPEFFSAFRVHAAADHRSPPAGQTFTGDRTLRRTMRLCMCFLSHRGENSPCGKKIARPDDPRAGNDLFWPIPGRPSYLLGQSRRAGRSRIQLLRSDLAGRTLGFLVLQRGIDLLRLVGLAFVGVEVGKRQLRHTV